MSYRLRMEFVAAVLPLLIATATIGRAGAEEPPSPATYRAAHFRLQTDLPRGEALEWIGRMESLVVALETYWGRPAMGQADGKLVKDLAHWPKGAFSEAAKKKIAAGVGLTDVESAWRGDVLVKSSVVMHASTANDTPLHEAVHVYFGLAFGRSGPVWFAEGLAEEGRYWRPGGRGVRLPDHVLKYLRGDAPPRPIDLLAADAASGDDWRAYASRWALCHFLLQNPNYARDFRRLGLALLNNDDVSFEHVFADGRQLEFEFQLWMSQLGQGDRVDLTAWSWQAEFRPPTGPSPCEATVRACRGWQPSGALVQQDDRYLCEAAGRWQVDSSRKTDASGGADGRGQMVGAIFDDYRLSDPFSLGSKTMFSPPASGQLWLRCRDNWGALEDNSGAISVRVSPARD